MRKSVMEHRFSEVPSVSMPRASFDRSHGYKTTFDCDYLIPVLLDDVLPGDTYQVDMNFLGRLSTPIYPIMDNLFLDSFFFFVPYRLLWSNFKKFMGEQANPADSISYTIPTIPTPAGGVANQSLADYFGIPTQVLASFNVNTLPFRAYNLIWNEWFRDENLQDSVVVDLDDGPDTYADYSLLKRGKRHDYFTSCLPWLQKGTAVDLPLGTSAPLTITGNGNPVFEVNGVTTNQLRGTTANSNIVWSAGTPAANDNATWVTPALTGTADLSSATAATINEIRQAFQVQSLLEMDARAGTRYTEIVKSHFGVTSPDARLQRSEYLGGGSTPISITPVAQTSESGTTDLGSLAAVGTVGGSGHGFVKSFTEHGVVLGMVCVRSDLTYQQGLERYWSKSTRYDFYLPILAHLGEQEVLNKEIFLNAAMVGGTAEDVFGYQERWAEYRYKPSKITGKFRSNDAASLEAWHLSEEFSALPTLDDVFIQQNTPLDRVVGAPTEPHMIFDSYFRMRTTRVMPLFSVPGLVQRF